MTTIVVVLVCIMPFASDNINNMNDNRTNNRHDTKTKFMWSSIKLSKIKGLWHFNGLVYSRNKYADNVVKCFIFSRVLAIQRYEVHIEWLFNR